MKTNEYDLQAIMYPLHAPEDSTVVTKIQLSRDMNEANGEPNRKYWVKWIK